MQENMPEEPHWSWGNVRGALERATRKWPSREEIELVFQAAPHRFRFGSVEEVEQVIATLHEREMAESRLEFLTAAIEERVLEGFLRQYVPEADHQTRDQVFREVRVILYRGDFDTLEGYLRDIAESGLESATKNLKEVDKAGKFRLSVGIIWAVVEVCLIFFVVAKCQRGFETIVVCALAILYCYIANLASLNSLEGYARYATLQYRLDRIRREVRDKSLDWASVENEQRTIANTLGTQEWPRHIRMTKLSIISLGCILIAIYTSL